MPRQFGPARSLSRDVGHRVPVCMIAIALLLGLVGKILAFLILGPIVIIALLVMLIAKR